MEHFDAGPQGLVERIEAERDDHELLDVDRVVRVAAAVDDVHHRDRKPVRPDSADVAKQRQEAGAGRRVRTSERTGQDGVGPQVRFVLGAVGLDHRMIDRRLVGHVEVDQRLGERFIDVLDGLADAFPEIAALGVGVAQLVGFVPARAGPAGDGGPPDGPVFQLDVDFDGRISAAVQDLAGIHSGNGQGHRDWLPSWIAVTALPLRHGYGGNAESSGILVARRPFYQIPAAAIHPHRQPVRRVSRQLAKRRTLPHRRIVAPWSTPSNKGPRPNRAASSDRPAHACGLRQPLQSVVRRACGKGPHRMGPDGPVATGSPERLRK